MLVFTSSCARVVRRLPGFDSDFGRVPLTDWLDG